MECLHLDERYLEAMLMFEKEMCNLRDRYNLDRENPLVAPLMPPVAGRITWIRHYYKRITDPMEIFKTRPRVEDFIYS